MDLHGGGECLVEVLDLGLGGFGAIEANIEEFIMEVAEVCFGGI